MSFCISKGSNFKRDTLHFLYDKYVNEDSTKAADVFGGIVSNLHYAWLVRKSRIVVVNCKNASRVGSWDFGNTLQDDTVEINKVEEIQRPNGKEPHLIISLNCETRGGMICIFDFVGSKVIRAIQIGDNITSVHVIDRGQDLFSLSGPLRNFDGVLAVGTVGGNVYILDICRQLCYEGFNSVETRDEMNPCQIKIITAGNLLDLENCKKIALCNESHLAIFLNVVQNKKTEHFVLKGPGGTDVLYVNKEEVLISSLHYCPQLSSILVGYNFGAFQLWDLMNMELVYTSPICEDHIPIIKFAIQEPADDPRAFCYVWAVYSSEDLESKVLPNLVMYALCYESKEFHENYGILYENFQYCTVRFQRELGFGNNQSNIKVIGGKCLNLDSLVLKNSASFNEMYGNDGTEDALSLCVAAWKAVCENGQFTFMAVFDLNQWYKAQMPNSSNLDDCSSYMITLCISDLTNTDGENKIEIFDVILNKKSVQQFIGTQRLEEHYYPSSLSFETSCLLENKIVNIQYQGVQTALLSQLQKAGPLCLIRPSETYQEIVALGLTPLFVELNTTSAITSLNNQREVILSVALEQQLTSWLCKCASEWANGSFSSAGCSLELLTSWAHQRALTLKAKCDDLCIPMFDYSAVKLDANTINVLSNCIRQIKNISFLLSHIVNKFSSYMTNKDKISELCNHLKMLEMYFDVLQWFLNVGILPELTPLHYNLANVAKEEKVRAPYPLKEMEEYYSKRRAEMLLSLNNRLSMKKSVLFIDYLLNVEFDGRLEKDWQKDGGTGFYPPRSIQALLRTYLMEGMEMCNKHSLVIYLLSDLAAIFDAPYRPLITNLMKFPAVFKVSPSYIKITHGFWQLDHGGLNHAMEQLLDPMVNQEDLKNWHHKVALKSLLFQGQNHLALLYMNVRKPPIVDDEDVLCALSLFISNNMLDEAFYLEKNFSNYSTSKIFIKHLFSECSNYGRLNSIIHRNLTKEEETQFLNYLDEVKHPDAADLKITYFMQRSQYKEAFHTYQACEDDPTKKGLLSRLNLKARDQIVHTFKKFLPTVSYDFIENCTRDPNPTLWKEVSRPDPMSVCVHKADTKTEYKSSMILAALAKARLTFNESVHNISLLNARTEEIPFLRTPTAVPAQKRSSVQVIIPKIVVEEDEEEYGPSPPKRSRLSSSSSHHNEHEMNTSILSTPIIARKVRSYVSPIEKDSEEVVSTPASILKVRSSYKTDVNNISTPTGSTNTPLRTIEHKSLISARKSTRTSMVRFDVPASSPEEPSSSLRSIREVQTPDRNDSVSFENSSKSVSQSITPKNLSDTDETFYSPNSSLNNIEELPKDTSTEEKQSATEEQPEEPTIKISPKKIEISKAELVKIVDYNSSSSEATASTSSPKGRRSYRKNVPDVTSVRSSPRLSRGRDSTVTEKEKTDSDETMGTEENRPSPAIFSTGRRKSLNRQVLEANTLARIACSSSKVETTRTEVFKEERKTTSMVIDNENSEISHTRIEYADSYRKESSSPEKVSEIHSVSTSQTYITETTLESDSSESVQSRADSVDKKGIGRERTPVRRTRASSKLYEGNSSFDSCEKSQNEYGEISIQNNDHKEDIEKQTGTLGSVEGSTASFETATSSIPSKITITSPKEKFDLNSSNISQNNDDFELGEPSDRSPLRKKSFLSSTPHLSSLQKLKANLTKRSRHPLSRQVLEYNALSRLKSEYETSSNEEMEIDEVETVPDASHEITVSSCGFIEKQSDISISDSVLELLAYQNVPSEKELREHEKSIDFPEEKEVFETTKNVLPGRNEFSIVPEVSTLKQSNISISDSVLELLAYQNLPNEKEELRKQKPVDFPEEKEVFQSMENVVPGENKFSMVPEVKQSNISVFDSPHNIVSSGDFPEDKEVLENRGECSTHVEHSGLFTPSKISISRENILKASTQTSATKQMDISLSDSVLEILTSGRIPQEKQTLEHATYPAPQVKTEICELTKTNENIVEFTPELGTTIETHMSLAEACSVIYDDLDDGSKQSTPENLDSVLNFGMLEPSLNESGLICKSEELRQEDVSPSELERNISDRDSTTDNLNKNSDSNNEIIELLSSDGSESKSSSASSSETSTSEDSLDKNISENLTKQNDNLMPSKDENNPELMSEDMSDDDDQDSEMKDDLNVAILAEEISIATSDVNTTIPSVIICDSHGENSQIKSKSDSPTQESGSDENAKSKKNVNSRNKKSSPAENETKTSVTKEDVKRTTGRRITRRSSKQLDDQDDTEENKINSLVKNDEVPNTSSARRVSSRRSSQTSELNLGPSSTAPISETEKEQPKEIPKSVITRKRTRSVDIPIDVPMEENEATTSKGSQILRARRKLRSASVDIPNTIDEESKNEPPAVGKSKKKPSSISDVNEIKEEIQSSKKSSKSAKEDLVENYRKGRRLTRRQSNIFEQSMSKVDLSSMDTQDPIELLDKTEFKGTPDPQEAKVYDTSPSSSASTARSTVGRPARRQSRTNSNASDDSVTSVTSTPGRRKKAVVHVDSPVIKLTRRKLRSASTEENPESESPEKAKDKASDIMSDDGVESDTSVISTRSRKSSKSDTNNSSKTRKRKVVSKSALPEISEENVEVVSGSPAQNTRRGRKTVQK